MGSDLSVVNAARVSFYKESELENGTLSGKDQKLVGYLAAHNHFTPFCHSFLSFRIKAPIFVARQLVKHQVGLAWNEVSRRYVDDEPEFWFPQEWRGKPVNAKQGSSDEDLTELKFMVDGNKEVAEVHIFNSVFQANEIYKQMIHQGFAPEQARMVLPQNMMTEWIWSGSLAAFARVCKLRLDPHAQQETREIAEQINGLVPDNFKHSWSALLG